MSKFKYLKLDQLFNHIAYGSVGQVTSQHVKLFKLLNFAFLRKFRERHRQGPNLPGG